MPDCEFDLLVTPRSSQRKLEALPDGSLKAWVQEAPADGQANQGVIALAAEAFRVPQSRISIRWGQASRRKRIKVEGLTVDEALLILRSAPQGTKSPKRPGK